MRYLRARVDASNPLKSKIYRIPLIPKPYSRRTFRLSRLLLSARPSILDLSPTYSSLRLLHLALHICDYIGSNTIVLLQEQRRSLLSLRVTSSTLRKPLPDLADHIRGILNSKKAS